jgi:hypothetical protein
VAAPPPRSSGVLPGDDFLVHSGMAKVSTPFRVWTV